MYKKLEYCTILTAAAILIAAFLLTGCFGGAAPRPIAPEVISDGRGGAIIAWHSKSDLYTQRVDSEGNLLWGQGGIRIRSAATRPGNPLIAGDSAGGAIIAWTGRHGETELRWSVFAQRLDSQGNAVWTEGGIQVSTEPDEVAQSLIDLASDGSGGAILLWYKEWKVDERWKTTVHAQRVTADGDCLWGEQGILVYDTAPDPRWAKLVSDGAGGAVIVWEDNRGPDTDIYAQRISSDGRLLWPDMGVAVASASNAQLGPQIISDGMGNLIVVWVQSPGTSYYVGDTDIYAQKINSNGEPLWTAKKGIPVCMAAGSQGYPQVASDGSGGCIVVWHDTRNRPNRDVYAQRVSSEGKILWGADGVLIWDISAVDKSSVEAGRYDIQIVGDSNGAIVVWQANPKSATVGAFKGGQIYAQRLSPTSERLWPEAIRVYENPSLKSQAYSSVVSDSVGGVIIGSIVGKGDWPDLVYAQRIDSDGNRLWGEGGIRLDY
ncbi:hypothetical protein ES703_102066 [subsurface metagenome]